MYSATLTRRSTIERLKFRPRRPVGEPELAGHFRRMGVQHDLAQRIVGTDGVVDIDRVVAQKFGEIRHARRVNPVLGFLDAEHGAIVDVHQHQDEGDVPQRAVREERP